jgi:hypothetical protein
MAIISKIRLHMTNHLGYAPLKEVEVGLASPQETVNFRSEGGTKTMNGSLLSRIVIRLILTAPPAKVLSGVSTERSHVIITAPLA